MGRAFWILISVAALSSATGADDPQLRSAVQGWRVAHEAQIVAQLGELTRIRSVAADPQGLRAAAAELLHQLQERGFDARLLSVGAAVPPAVFGERRTPGATRTVVFYAHYDGQPVVPSEWSSDPFMPVMRSGPLHSGEHVVDWRVQRPPFDPQWRLFGRAAADDKASIVAFLAAFDALSASDHAPSVNLKVLWEGEEEAGSPHLASILSTYRALLTSDLWLIGDGPVHQSRRQMIYFGARGITGLTMTIYGALTPLHDGHYGNWAPNPAVMAAVLIAQMRDDDGNILIPGLAAHVRPLTAAERQAIRELPPVQTQLEQQFGLGRTEGHEGLALSLMRPALNVRGIRAGQVGAAAANAIPSEAEVSIDFRLVPDQTPQDVRRAVEAFLIAKGWTIVTGEPDKAARLAHPRLVRLAWEPGYPALRSDMSTPAALAVIHAADQAAKGPVAVMPMAGGSVPLYLFSQRFGVPVIGLPIVNFDDDQHAPNENLRLQNLWEGIQTYAAMMASLQW